MCIDKRAFSLRIYHHLRVAFDLTFCSSSGITHTNWRTQVTTVHSLGASPRVLSRHTIATGLVHAPPRSSPANSIPSWSSLAFHPNEMLLAIGGADGTIKVMGSNLDDTPEPDGAHRRSEFLDHDGFAPPSLASIRSMSS